MSPVATHQVMPESSCSKPSDESRSRFANLRGVRWRIDLGILPRSPSSASSEFSSFIDDIRRVTADFRRRYAALRRRLLLDPHTPKSRISSVNLVIENPLSQNPDSNWGRLFFNAELEKMVDKDLSRLYPEHGSYFQTPACQGMLRRILLLWCLRHPEHGYKQGMHELLAPLLYVLHVDVVRLSEVRKQYEDHFTDEFDDGLSFYENDITQKFDLKKFVDTMEDEISSHDDGTSSRSFVENDPEIKTIVLLSDIYGAEGELGIVLSEKFMEHDAYCMFDALMSGAHGSIAMADFYSPSAPGESHSSLPPVIEASTTFYQLLSVVDSSLHSHLVELGVEPQYFALRWLRVLFGREFSLDHLLLIWDEIFAADSNRLCKNAQNDATCSPGVFSSPQGALISAIAVSMILYLRSSLLSTDNATACLKRLLNFPENIDLRKILDNAKSLHDLALETNISATSSSIFESYTCNKKMVVRGHSLSSDCVSPKTPLNVVPDSYWEDKWRLLHKSEEPKHCSSQKQNTHQKRGWSEKVRLRLSRTWSDSSSSKAGCKTDYNSSVRRNLLKNLSRELGMDEDTQKACGHEVSGRKDYPHAVEDKQGVFCKNLTFSDQERQSSENAGWDASSVLSDTSYCPNNDEENDLEKSGVASKFYIDGNDHTEVLQDDSALPVSDSPETFQEGTDNPVSDHPLAYSSASSEENNKLTGDAVADLNERKLLSKFQWFWKLGRNAVDEERSERKNKAVVNMVDDTRTNTIDYPSADGPSNSCASGKGDAADVMVTLRIIGHSMLEHVQVIESVFQQDRGQVGSLESFSKNIIVGKGQATAITALKELRKISNLLSEM